MKMKANNNGYGNKTELVQQVSVENSTTVAETVAGASIESLPIDGVPRGL